MIVNRANRIFQLEQELATIKETKESEFVERWDLDDTYWDLKEVETAHILYRPSYARHAYRYEVAKGLKGARPLEKMKSGKWPGSPSYLYPDVEVRKIMIGSHDIAYILWKRDDTLGWVELPVYERRLYERRL